MVLTPRSAPHIRDSASNRSVMGDVILCLLALYFMSAFYYGPRALSLGLWSIAVCWISDIICIRLRGRRFNIRDWSAVVTGMMIPLLMPATISYTAVAVAGVFAICLVKHPFGGLGYNMFNPAAGGVAFAMVCWPTEMFAYPNHFVSLPTSGAITVPLVASDAYSLYLGGAPTNSFNNILLGLVPGPMGATNVLVIMACILYLAARRTVRPLQPILCLVTVTVLAFLFPRGEYSRWLSVYYELMCTSVVFCAAFMFSDPVTSPKRGMARAMYGVLGGIVIMIFRWYGGYEETVLFALLLLNAICPAFDTLVEGWIAKERRGISGPTSIRISGEDDDDGENAGNVVG